MKTYAPLRRKWGLIFLSLVVLSLCSMGASKAQAIGVTKIDQAIDAFQEEEQQLVAIDYYKDVSDQDLLQNYVTLSDVWSYLYRYRAEGEKLLKDAWLSFKQDADFDQWKAFWPSSVSLLVAWEEDSEWNYAALSASADVDADTGETTITWFFNEWRDQKYNIYTLRDYLVDKFIPASMRAVQGPSHYEQLQSVLRTGEKDGQFEIHMKWFGGHLEIPVALIILGTAAFLKRRK